MKTRISDLQKVVGRKERFDKAWEEGWRWGLHESVALTTERGIQGVVHAVDESVTHRRATARYKATSLSHHVDTPDGSANAVEHRLEMARAAARPASVPHRSGGGGCCQSG